MDFLAPLLKVCLRRLSHEILLGHVEEVRHLRGQLIGRRVKLERRLPVNDTQSFPSQSSAKQVPKYLAAETLADRHRVPRVRTPRTPPRARLASWATSLTNETAHGFGCQMSRNGPRSGRTSFSSVAISALALCCTGIRSRMLIPAGSGMSAIRSVLVSGLLSHRRRASRSSVFRSPFGSRHGSCW